MRYLREHGIFFRQIDLESPQGQAIARSHEIKASPGILVDGVSYNPFDLLLPADCRVNEKIAAQIFHI